MSCEKQTSEQARTRTTKGNEENNIKVCVCLLSSHDVLFLCLAKAVVSFFILCLSFLDDYKEI